MEIFPVNADRFLSRNDLNMAESLLSPTQKSPLGRSPSLSPKGFKYKQEDLNPFTNEQSKFLGGRYATHERKTSVSVLTGAQIVQMSPGRDKLNLFKAPRGSN